MNGDARQLYQLPGEPSRLLASGLHLFKRALHYPIEADLFTSLLVIEGAPIQWCFLALGILASAATAKTLWNVSKKEQCLRSLICRAAS